MASRRAILEIAIYLIVSSAACSSGLRKGGIFKKKVMFMQASEHCFLNFANSMPD